MVAGGRNRAGTQTQSDFRSDGRKSMVFSFDGYFLCEAGGKVSYLL